jgi:alpha-tubulin suppressor-like RCC1 family protein
MQWRKRRDWRGLLAIVPLAAVVTLAVPAPTSASAATPGSTGPALYTWGANRGNFNFTQFPSPTTLPGGVAPKSVENGSATAGGDAFVIGADGGIYAWGSNYCGEIGNGNKDPVHMPVAIPLPGGEKATQVSAGYCFTMALGTNGHIYTWGKNDKGALGDGTTTDHLTPQEISLPGGVTATSIAAGDLGAFGMAMGSDGHVYAWGDGGLGDPGSKQNTNTPRAVDLPDGVVPTAIAGGASFALVLDSAGNVYSWGYNHYGQLGRGNFSYEAEPPGRVELGSGRRAKSISAGFSFGMALTTDGRVLTWGSNFQAELGHRDASDRGTPYASPAFLDAGVEPVTAILASFNSAFAISHDGTLWAWGNNNNGQVGNGVTGPDDCYSGKCAKVPMQTKLPTGASITSLGRNAGGVAAIVTEGTSR